jgi:hypothetical protein
MGLSMKKYYLIIICLISVNVFSQSDDKVGFSFDVGLTNFLLETTTNDVLTPLGYTNLEYSTTNQTLISPHIGANIHYKYWVFGAGWQRERLHEIDVKPMNTPYIDRLSTTISWWSAYAERHVKARENFYPYLAVGVTHSTIRGFARNLGNIGRVKVKETDPFVRAGLSYQFKKATIRWDATRRFTDDEDSTNLIRFTVRYPFR